MGRLDEAKSIIGKLWGAHEVETAISEFLQVCRTDGSDLDSKWLELLGLPHSRGCVKVVLWLLIRL